VINQKPGGTSNGHTFSVSHEAPAKEADKEATKETPKASAAPEAATPKSKLPAAAKQKGGVTTRGLNKIAQLTDVNDHGGAIMAGAKMLGRQDIHDTVKKIRDEHMKLGGLNEDLMNRRNAAYKELMAHSKATLSPEDHQKFYNSF
jgi:hypothetical protein